MAIRYEVLAGRHVEPTGRKSRKIYKKGDVVVSDIPLDKIFKGKFRNVGEEPKPKAKKPKAEAPAPSKPTKPTPPPETDDKDSWADEKE